MFKALDSVSGREVISLDEDPAALRSLERSHGLICQECQHRVFPRSGESRRTHFAHYSLEDCPVRSESPELLRARAVLYDWLKDRYFAADPAAHVTLEKKMESAAGFFRPLDCYVQFPGDRKIAYWILQGSLRPERRDELVNAFEASGLLVHWLFLKPPKGVDQEVVSTTGVLLNTTERELMKSRQNWPKSVAKSGLTTNFLQSLDGNGKTVQTWRSLSCRHPPQQYDGQLHQNSLVDLDLLAPTGHILHPGEREMARARLQELKDKRAQEEAARARLQALRDDPARQQAAHARLRELREEQAKAAKNEIVSISRPVRKVVRGSYREPEPGSYDGPSLHTARLTCRRCRQIQKPGAWTQAELSKGTCLCRACSL